MHQLALRLGKPNVNAMLREMTSAQWCQWKAFLELEPVHLSEERADHRAASIAAAVWNAAFWSHSSQQHRSFREFLASWGDNMSFFEPPKRQSSLWDDIKDYAASIGRSKKQP